MFIQPDEFVGDLFEFPARRVRPKHDTNLDASTLEITDGWDVIAIARDEYGHNTRNARLHVFVRVRK
jgi:hypothetical protein